MEATLEPTRMVFIAPEQRTWMEGLGEALRARREALGLTQTELGKRAGLDQNTVSQIETGRRKWPRREAREAIARQLGWTNLQWLVAAGEVDPDDAGVTASDDLAEEVQAIVRSLDDESLAKVRDFALFMASNSRPR